jgi:hypothetical protein
MFRALLAHPQEALHQHHLVYCVRMSVDCGTVAATVPIENILEIYSLQTYKLVI